MSPLVSLGWLFLLSDEFILQPVYLAFTVTLLFIEIVVKSSSLPAEASHLVNFPVFILNHQL